MGFSKKIEQLRLSLLELNLRIGLRIRINLHSLENQSIVFFL